MKIVDNVKTQMEMRKGDVLSQVRFKHIDRWMDVCGVDSPEDIDYDNPFVKIEWLLCDPGWLHAIKSKKGRDQFLERLDDPLAKWIYLYYRDEETGDSYRDLEKNHFARDLRRALSKK